MFDIIEYYRKNLYRRKGQSYLVKGQPEKAYPYFEKVLMMEDSPTNLFNVALTLLAMRRFEEAQNYLEKILEAHPGNELASLTLAEITMQQRDWDKARKLVEALVEQHPTNSNYRRYLTRLEDPKKRENYVKGKELLNEAQKLLERGEVREALDILLKAEKIDPENAYIQNNIGYFYLQLEKNPKKALTYFQRAYQLEPENNRFKENLYQVRKKIKE